MYGAELNRPKTRSRLTWQRRGRERRERTLFIAKGNPRHPAFRHQHRQPAVFHNARDKEAGKGLLAFMVTSAREQRFVCVCVENLLLSRGRENIFSTLQLFFRSFAFKQKIISFPLSMHTLQLPAV